VNKRPDVIEYHRSPPHPDRWQWRRIVALLPPLCVVGAMYCGFVSYVLSHRVSAPQSIFTLPTTYIALALGGAGIAIFIVSLRQHTRPGRSGDGAGT